jgi:hypothetical protein
MPAAGLPADPRHSDPATLGAEGNERLTAWAGAALLIGLAAEGVTLLNVHWWLTAHMLIGIALLPPVAVKAGSTMYRFARYYTSSPAYVRKGPPRPLLRILGPFLLLNTAFILLSGVAIPLAGSYRHQVEGLHKLSFWTWAAFFAVHVLAYVWRLPGLLIADLAGRGTFRSTAFQRIVVVAVSAATGMALALVLMPWVRDWIAR